MRALRFSIATIGCRVDIVASENIAIEFLKLVKGFLDIKGFKAVSVHIDPNDVCGFLHELVVNGVFEESVSCDSNLLDACHVSIFGDSSERLVSFDIKVVMEHLDIRSFLGEMVKNGSCFVRGVILIDDTLGLWKMVQEFGNVKLGDIELLGDILYNTKHEQPSGHNDSFVFNPQID